MTIRKKKDITFTFRYETDNINTLQMLTSTPVNLIQSFDAHTLVKIYSLLALKIENDKKNIVCFSYSCLCVNRSAKLL